MFIRFNGFNMETEKVEVSLLEGKQSADPERMLNYTGWVMISFGELLNYPPTKDIAAEASIIFYKQRKGIICE